MGAEVLKERLSEDVLEGRLADVDRFAAR